MRLSIKHTKKPKFFDVSKSTPALFNAVKSEFGLTAWEFIGIIQERWYTGRKGNDMGLNVQSGFLRDKWVATTSGTTLESLKSVMSSGVEYSVYQEDGVPDRNLPKRSDVKGDLNSPEIGKKLFVKAFKTAFYQVFKR